jgi:hypothetical protein
LSCLDNHSSSVPLLSCRIRAALELFLRPGKTLGLATQG